MTRLNVLREGEGPIVVLSHALGCDLHMWDGVAEVLARAHTVLRYDHRNHGASEVVPGPLSLQALADDAAALIAREAGGEPVHFVGLSMGGMTAQALAPKHPELLRSVVIANSSAWYSDRAPWRTRVETVQAQGVAAIAPGAVARWLTPAYVSTPEGAETFHDAMDFIRNHHARVILAAVPGHVMEVLKNVPEVRSQLPICATVADARRSLDLGVDVEEDHGKKKKKLVAADSKKT